MEEAERLCDRVAVVDTGRVVALGTPGELSRGAGGPGAALPRRGADADDLLATLPEVTDVRREGDEVVVTGGADVLAPSPRRSPARASSPSACASSRPPWRTRSSP